MHSVSFLPPLKPRIMSLWRLRSLEHTRKGDQSDGKGGRRLIGLRGRGEHTAPQLEQVLPEPEMVALHLGQVLWFALTRGSILKYFCLCLLALSLNRELLFGLYVGSVGSMSGCRNGGEAAGIHRTCSARGRRVNYCCKPVGRAKGVHVRSVCDGTNSEGELAMQ